MPYYLFVIMSKAVYGGVCAFQTIIVLRVKWCLAMTILRLGARYGETMFDA
jgi:hypothetical protein